MNEHNIQSLIMCKLSEMGFVPLRANSGIFWQGKQVTINGTKALIDLKAVKGMPKGTSDIICIMPNGQVAWIECKTLKGKQRDDQIRFQKMIESMGHKYYVMRSVDDCNILINSFKKT